jgi:hypothetical protein
MARSWWQPKEPPALVPPGLFKLRTRTGMAPRSLDHPGPKTRSPARASHTPDGTATPRERPERGWGLLWNRGLPPHRCQSRSTHQESPVQIPGGRRSGRQASAPRERHRERRSNSTRTSRSRARSRNDRTRQRSEQYSLSARPTTGPPQFAQFATRTTVAVTGDRFRQLISRRRARCRPSHPSAVLPLPNRW